jgi:hypothetical protein
MHARTVDVDQDARVGRAVGAGELDSRGGGRAGASDGELVARHVEPAIMFSHDRETGT